MANDYYAILGVSRDADDATIKKAYRTLAREFHPDRNPGDAEAESRFKELAVAYEVLSDPEKRARFDRFGAEGVGGAGGPGMGDVFNGGIGDLFDVFFGGGGGGGGNPFGGGATTDHRAGEDLETVLEVPFERAVFGGEQSIDVATAVGCDACEGSGCNAGTSPVTCSQCDGAGQIRQVRRSILGQMVSASPCVACSATGQQIPDPCGSCGGEGRVRETRSYSVDVPAGVGDGSTLRLTGRGAVGRRGGGSGDLYVHLRVQPHERFQRDGYDLIDTLPVGIAQAALGAAIEYETLDGTEDMVIKPGTQPGRVFRLRGRGVPHLDGRGRGDLLVRVAVAVPESLSDEETELLKKFAELRGESVAPEAGFLKKIRSAFK